MATRSIFRFLYRLAARAPTLQRQQVMGKLVTGLANHFNAMTVRLYTSTQAHAIASADEDEDIELLDLDCRARLAEMEAQLVRRVFDMGKYASALDLDPEGDLEDFLRSTIGVIDVFAFPVDVDGRTFGAVLLYLPVDSPSLAEPDQQALMSLGELIRLAGSAIPV